MSGEPPIGLVSLLERLRLATAAQVSDAAPRVRRLAGDLPDFESVWVDALRQAGILTALQAAEINAGRGEDLLCGPYVLARSLASPHYAECFAAHHVDTGRTVRLYRVTRLQATADLAARALRRLIDQLRPLAGPAASVVEDAGIVGAGIWATAPAVVGTTAAEWMSENGRFPASAVLHLARETLNRLADLELVGAVHGDVGTAGLVFQTSGRMVLPMPGLRGIVRPQEGYSFHDLSPEAYDYLAPERVSDGTPPTAASDLYACGCLWWHLLTGRPPFPGGNSLGKLKAVHAARVVDVRQFAPDVPPLLATAIDLCLARDPAERPQSAADLLELLGPTARGGQTLVARCLAGEGWLWRQTGSQRRVRRSRRRRTLVAATITAIALVALPTWWLSRRDREGEAMAVAGSTETRADGRGAAGASHVAPATGADSVAHRPAAPEHETHFDPQVKPAAALVPRESQNIAAPPRDPATPADLVLASGKAIRAVDLRLRAGQRVRGRSGERPVVRLSEKGLSVNVDRVRFEGIDFVWEDESPGSDARGRPPAMVTVRAQAFSAHGCSFSTAGSASPVAIAWHGSQDALPDDNGAMELVDCVFRGVDAVIDCRSAAGLAVGLSNTLCVAAGPLVRLYEPRPADRTLTLTLERATTRGDCAVLECHYAKAPAEAGPMIITASDSALVTNPAGGLLILAGPQSPASLTKAIAWNGQGSLVSPDAAVAQWRDRSGTLRDLPEEDLDVGGLVRSDVEFAGPAYGSPAASRITRWQVPLRSADPPGANVDVLYLPAE
ncbi:MAG: serine/threonine protein kinase [Pirellulales bacterium]